MKTINVPLKNNSYKIYIGKSIFSDLPSLIEKNNLYQKIAVIIDDNAYKNHKEKVNDFINLLKNQKSLYRLKPGEKSKSYTELNRIYSYLINEGYFRDTLIIAIGGGVTGDLAGYAASTYMRGVQVVHIPTTLLAAVDSSIGGKTGINFNKTKNIIGAFYQPEFVLIDSDFLSTLPAKELVSGLGEVIKYSFITDDKTFQYINKNIDKAFSFDDKVILNLIIKSAECKAGVVSKDEKESGLRKILNFGHTFAHAFESDLKFRVKHGEAVIAGVICALLLSNKKGLLPNHKLDEYLKLPLKVKLPSLFKKINFNNVFTLMKMDKKNRNKRINFVLISGAGKVHFDADAEKEDIDNVLKNFIHLI